MFTLKTKNVKKLIMFIFFFIQHDVYHVYATIPDEPEEATVAKQLYYTLQAHWKTASV